MNKEKEKVYCVCYMCEAEIEDPMDLIYSDDRFLTPLCEHCMKGRAGYKPTINTEYTWHDVSDALGISYMTAERYYSMRGGDGWNL